MTKMGWAYLQFLNALPQGIDPVDAGQNQPIVFADSSQAVVEGFVGAGRANFDERNLQHVRPEQAKSGRECAGLLSRPADQNELSLEWQVGSGFGSGLFSGVSLHGCCGTATEP